MFISPMPHASIRIGGVVYNYGVFEVSRMTLRQFRESVGFGEAASGAHTRIELKLSPDEVSELREILETDVATMYPLTIPFNDCVSMTNRAVRDAAGIDVPPVLDRSQIGSILYYKFQRLLHPERFGTTTYASPAGPNSSARLQEAAANSLDAMMFLRWGPAVIGIAPILDSIDTTYDPADGLGTPGNPGGPDVQ
jgi:hypothetical protein